MDSVGKIFQLYGDKKKKKKRFQPLKELRHQVAYIFASTSSGSCSLSFMNILAEKHFRVCQRLCDCVLNWD